MAMSNLSRCCRDNAERHNVSSSVESLNCDTSWNKSLCGDRDGNSEGVSDGNSEGETDGDEEVDGLSEEQMMYSARYSSWACCY